MVIINMQFRRLTAAMKDGRREKFNEVIEKLATCIKEWKAHLLVGDFNAAAPHVKKELKPRAPKATICQMKLIIARKGKGWAQRSVPHQKTPQKGLSLLAFFLSVELL